MALFGKKYTTIKVKRREFPEGLWTKCNKCSQIIYTKELEKNLKVCPKCNADFRYITSRRSSSASLKALSNLHKRRPDLICIEFKDLKIHKDREKARDFLS